MLAVVYETFTGIEKDKFRKLLLHKRQACKLAFRLLVSKQNPNHIRFKQFHGVMRYYSPKTSKKEMYLKIFSMILYYKILIMIFLYSRVERCCSHIPPTQHFG